MKHIHIWVFGICFSVLFLCACSAPPEPVGSLLSKACAKASNGDWLGADTLARQVLKQENANIDALLLCALARSNLDSEREAIDYAMKAAELAPGNFHAQYIKGFLLYKSGKYDLALGPLRAARNLREDDLNTLILLAQTSYVRKNLIQSAGYYSLLVRIPKYGNSPLPWNGIGVCYAQSNPRKALAFFRKAEQLSPYDPATALNLAVLYDVHLRQPAAAKSYYERFLRLSTGKAEYDSIRGTAELRFDSMKGK
ncbi:MAG: hypothetical protein BWY31_01594 [Lentisphaerae bacterium ADurb.Bin242]|nr:MAG: hypothetical protein BWY31_01594 [Lentisphaerae bacterium ADurb.Bin242]